MSTRKALRALIEKREFFLLPGVYDGVSAHLVEDLGFDAAYMTGSGTAASVIGAPDLGLATLTEMADHVRHLVAALEIPLVADADTGYGNAINVYRTVKEYERAGVAALHIEDQTFPKRCGHTEGTSVVPEREFVAKLHAAVDSRTDPDLVIIARTDSRGVEGIDRALERANSYAEAGADVIFVEAPQTKEEIERIPREVACPTMFNWVVRGKTPETSFAELSSYGYSFAIVPDICIGSAVMGMQSNLIELREKKILSGKNLMSPQELLDIIGIKSWNVLIQKYGEGK